MAFTNILWSGTFEIQSDSVQYFFCLFIWSVKSVNRPKWSASFCKFTDKCTF